MADAVAEAGCRDGAELDLHEEILMLVIIDNLFAYICDTQALECLDTAVTGEVDDHAAKIYNQVFNAFHDSLFDSNYLCLPAAATSVMPFPLLILTYPAIYQPDK